MSERYTSRLKYFFLVENRFGQDLKIFRGVGIFLEKSFFSWRNRFCLFHIRACERNVYLHIQCINKNCTYFSSQNFQTSKDKRRMFFHQEKQINRSKKIEKIGQK